MTTIPTTIFSDCRNYRYTLWRAWGNAPLFTPREITRESSYVMFIGLNPSTADETRDDPTIRKCMGFAQRWGYEGLCMTNLFAFRATQPRDMRAELYPTGPHNLDHVLQCAAKAAIVVAAWGANGSYKGRDRAMMEDLAKHGVHPVCLRLTSKGAPEHPLYVPYDVTPLPFTLPTP